MGKDHVENFDDFVEKIPNEGGNKLITLYIPTTKEKWESVWKYPEYSFQAGRATNAFKTEKMAYDHSDKKTVVKVDNIEITAIMGFIEQDAKSEADWTYVEDYPIKDKERVFNDYDMFLVDFYEYRKFIRTTLL